jgi:hypothetical protein
MWIFSGLVKVNLWGVLGKKNLQKAEKFLQHPRVGIVDAGQRSF